MVAVGGEEMGEVIYVEGKAVDWLDLPADVERSLVASLVELFRPPNR